MTHTPAPWTIQHGPRVYLINGPKGHALGVYADTRNPSDAQLIAAAPDLLAALQLLMSDPARKGLLTGTVITARAAIYKAIGA